MRAPIWYALQKIVADGNLTMIDPAGRQHRFGNGSGAPVVARVKDRQLEWALSTDPHLALGEGYMQGRLVIERGSLYDFLCLLARNLGPGAPPAWVSLIDSFRALTRRLQQYNPLSRARRNVAHHYDIGNDFYRLFLDRDWQYSCAYFPHEGATLEEAQDAKKRLIAAKLRISQGQTVLDVGSGWGGLALDLARSRGAHVTGITLSEEQAAFARQRAADEHLEHRVSFRLQDYRTVHETFDRIVSVGMFEHVGVPHYPEFFGMIRRCLKDDGVALLHSIGRSGPPGRTNPFIAKYIFPGGYIPALSEVLPAIEREGLLVTDIQILRVHYAKTLAAWRERFLKAWPRVSAMFSDEFCRMWEFYLSGCEAAFRYQDLMVFQVQLAKSLDALPITPDYVWDEFSARPPHRALV